MRKYLLSWYFKNFLSMRIRQIFIRIIIIMLIMLNDIFFRLYAETDLGYISQTFFTIKYPLLENDMTSKHLVRHLNYSIMV